MHIDRICSQHNGTQMLRGEHSAWCLGDTYQAQMSGAHTK